MQISIANFLELYTIFFFFFFDWQKNSGEPLCEREQIHFDILEI